MDIFDKINFDLPFFYNNEFAIRFELNSGGNTKEMIKASVDNSSSLFKSIFSESSGLLIYGVNISNYRKNRIKKSSSFIKCFKGYNSIKFSKTIKCEDYFKRTIKINIDKEHIDYKKLFEYIALQDFGGDILLPDQIFIIDESREIVYYMYDDRGADLVSTNKQSIKRYYHDFNDLILDYDREKINKIFQ